MSIFLTPPAVFRYFLTIAVPALTLTVSLAQPAHRRSLPGTEFEKAAANGTLTEEGYRRCERYVQDWLKYADPVSKLIPRNLDKDTDLWNANDCAADNYPFMVLTSFFTNRDRFDGLMKEMLRNERKLTSRVKSLPYEYSLSKKGFVHDEVSMGRVVFGTAEYAKDGLMPLTEWLGPSVWSDRMVEMLDDLGGYITVADDPKFSITTKTEVNGELLQVLSRMFWMTGKREYLDWAVKIGNYFLLGEGHPLKSVNNLRLRDHGCELISGLCELYATLHYTDRQKKESYREPLYRLLDHVLTYGRNGDGLFYNAINPLTNEVLDKNVSDSWGYNLNGYYTVFLVDGTERYREAVTRLFGNLDKYRHHDWEAGSADGYADAIESALNLYNRIPDERVANWIDSEIRVMWSMQDSSHRENARRWIGSGIIEGWHGDGNFARTTIMYNLWKSKGTYVYPLTGGVRLGGEMKGKALCLVVEAPAGGWTGKLYFDKARHSESMKMPLDWPRINQFPEWFTVDTGKKYRISDEKGRLIKEATGENLLAGIELSLKAGERKKMVVTPL